MSDNPMVRRCVTAMLESNSWSSFFEESDAIDLVRSVLKAMETPSDEMIAAGETKSTTTGIWKAMIRAALK